MTTFSRKDLRRPLHSVLTVAVTLAIIGVIWLDLATGLWQQAVILSGIAAGLLTFLLTSMFVERWLRRAEHRSWFPVTRLALTDILHALAEEETSEISRGIVHPVQFTPDDGTTLEPSDDLLTRIRAERDGLSAVLSRWGGFLAGSADVNTLMDHAADLARELEDFRDSVLEAELTSDATGVQEQARRVDEVIVRMIAEISDLLDRLDN